MRRWQDRADLVFEADPEELLLEARQLAPNAARRKRTVDLGIMSSPEYESLLVRTALVRSSTFGVEPLPQVQGAQQAAALARHLVHADQEHVVTIALNGKLEAVAVHEAAVGPAGQAAFTAADCVKVALLCGARALIVLHNHPSGDPRFSPEDLKAYKALKAAAECMGLELLDFLVVASKGFNSATGGAIPWD